MESVNFYFESSDRIDYYNIKFQGELDTNHLSKILEIPCFTQPEHETIAVGPHVNFKTAFSTNVTNILSRIGFTNIDQFEHIRLYDVNTNIIIDEMLEMKYSDAVSIEKIEYPQKIEITDSKTLNQFGVHFDEQELEIYQKMYEKMDRPPNFTELFDLCQSNSEHSRHWFFKGKLIKDINCSPRQLMSLFTMIKMTLVKPNNSLIAFSDNSSAIEGFKINYLYPEMKRQLTIKPTNMDIVFTAETHNFPTLICPFQGASTGIGGRIRDNHATGKGAYLIAGTAGYCVGNIDEHHCKQYPSPQNILIEASNGASDYGNKIGEPIINGFTHSFGMNFDGQRIEWLKPIMFTGGIGMMNRQHLKKDEPKEGMLVVRVGGPAYKIGLGGGFSSSVDQDGSRKKFELAAVQRGDPQMENKLNRVIKALVDLGDKNPIVSIHDQGAGGLANVVKEIVFPNGAEIQLDKVSLGDKSLHPLEIWCSEFQESDVMLINPDDIEVIHKICHRENVLCDIIGEITDSGRIVVTYKSEEVMNLPLKDVLEPEIQKTYKLDDYQVYSKPINRKYQSLFQISNLKENLQRVLKSIDVCSKRFLTNKVDRSVTGQIAQQQCVGPFHTPISNYGLVSLGYFNRNGAATAIGERPILGLISSEAQGSMSVGEMVTNMMGVYIGDISNIKCSVNWMWAAASGQEKLRLYDTAMELCATMKKLGIGIDGGKDSLSMSIRDSRGNTVNSPGNVVVSGYAPAEDVGKRVTPDFKEVGSDVIFLDLADMEMRLGGSVFLQEHEQLGDSAPTLENCERLKAAFSLIQRLIYDGKILALHDRSDGGLIVTLCEMCISSGIGLMVDGDVDGFYDRFFNEELGVVIEVKKEHSADILQELRETGIVSYVLGFTNNTHYFDILAESVNVGHFLIDDLSKWWEERSFEMERMQTNGLCALLEYRSHCNLTKPEYFIPESMRDFCYMSFTSRGIEMERPQVAIIREEGSNGDKEMCAVFHYVGFNVFDIHMNDLIKNPGLIGEFHGLVYVGGFSHGDVLGAGQGWHLTIKNNPGIQEEIKKFMERADTFSLGVCNGCQLQVKQGIFGNEIQIVGNDSGRFESRFSTVRVDDDKNIFFQGMVGMQFGIWVAHGEGKFVDTFELTSRQQVLKYTHAPGVHQQVDSHDKQTPLAYPYNPNGSEGNLAGICSENGRHLAMMPHPERCFMTWQLPYLGCYNDVEQSPWLKMFANIFEWSSNRMKSI